MTGMVAEFRLSGLGRVEAVEMPRGAVSIHVSTVDGALTIWALVDADAPRARYTFEVVRTGAPIDPKVPRTYVGTCCFLGEHVHVFMEVPRGV